MKLTTKKALKTLIGSFIFCILVFIACAAIGVKVNLSASMPLGLYKITDKVVLEKGDIVNFTVPNNAVIKQQYKKYPLLSKPECFLKVIYGVAGDEIFINDKTVLVGDHQLRLIDGVSTILQPGVISDGFIFVGTPHDKSFDSRYYGLILSDTITGVYKPLFTIGG